MSRPDHRAYRTPDGHGGASAGWRPDRIEHDQNTRWDEPEYSLALCLRDVRCGECGTRGQFKNVPASHGFSPVATGVGWIGRETMNGRWAVPFGCASECEKSAGQSSRN